MRLRLIAAFVAIGVAASGCTSSTSGDPTTAPMSATSSTPTSVTSTPTTKSSAPTSPPPTVPTTGPNVRPGEKRPELAGAGHTNSPQGQLAFATYWMQSIDWAYATTSSTLSRSLFDSTCAGCTRFLRNVIDYTVRHHEHFAGGRLHVISTSIQPNDHRDGATAVVDVTVNQTALKVVSASGKMLGRAKAVHGGRFRVWLRWLGSRWTVVDWKQAVSK